MSQHVFGRTARRLLAKHGAVRDAVFEAELEDAVAYLLGDGHLLVTAPEEEVWTLASSEGRREWLALLRQPLDDDEVVASFTKPWHLRSGVEPTDHPVACTLVRATIAELRLGLVKRGIRIVQNALGRRVEFGTVNAVVFQLQDSPWCEVLLSRSSATNARKFAGQLEAVRCVYTEHGMGYDRLHKRRVVESYRPGVDGHPKPRFESKLRRVNRMVLEDPHSMLDKTLKDLSAYVPAIDFGYFFEQGKYDQRPGQRRRVVNPGETLCTENGDVHYVPEFAALDFCALD